MTRLSDAHKLILFLAAIVGLLLLTHFFAAPPPPTRLTLATGREGGGYFQQSLRYQAYLRDHHIELQLLPGAGSLESLRRLRDGEADLGLVQGGTGDQVNHENLVSLASLFYEPLWVFHRADFSPATLRDLQGKRIAVGEEGSGTQALAKRILQSNQITADNAHWFPLSSREAAIQLMEGTLDAGLFVMSPTGDIVRELLANDQLRLFSFTRAAAYARRFPFLLAIDLPQGVLDFENNLPRQDVTLLAATASLVARNELEIEEIRRLTRMLIELHREGGVLAPAGRFPDTTGLEIAIHPEARRYLTSFRQRGWMR